LIATYQSCRTLQVKKILVLIVLLALASVVLWRFFPELVWPLVEHTPLKRPLSSSTPVYQWRDAQGNWQVTDEPPPEGVPYEIKQYQLDANIISPKRPELR
jgi:hypothetical protein